MSSILLSACYVLPPNPTTIVSKLQMVSVRLARTMCALAMTVLVGAPMRVVGWCVDQVSGARMADIVFANAFRYIIYFWLEHLRISKPTMVYHLCKRVSLSLVILTTNLSRLNALPLVPQCSREAFGRFLPLLPLPNDNVHYVFDGAWTHREDPPPLLSNAISESLLK